MEHDPTRRMLITALAGLTIASTVPVPSAAGTGSVQNKSRTLVVYFSRSGNTRVIAGVIHRSLTTDLFEIEPGTPYPEDYFQTVEQAKQERAHGTLPALKNNIGDFARYETVYLGFPIWGTSVPPVVQTFLSTHDLAGKLLISFITHGGYGKGDSDEVLARLAPAARRERPLRSGKENNRDSNKLVRGDT